MSQNNGNGLNNYTTNAPGGLTISVSNTRQAIDVMNNRSRQYADMAKQYKDEAKAYRDAARVYAEENSDVTMLYVNELEARLQGEIDQKQDTGDYALNSSIPVKVSDLTNDSGFLTSADMATTSDLGVVMVDGTTITADGNGVISADLSELQNKADVDLTNINPAQSAKDEIISWGMPDYSAGVSVTATQAINLNYDALLVWYKNAGAASTTNIAVYKGTNSSDLQIGVCGQSSSAGGGYYSLTLPLCKNEDYYIVFNGSAFVCKYYPLKGE